MVVNIKNTTTSSGLDQSLKIQTTASEDVDRATNTTETRWVNENWEKFNGYYKKHSSIKAVINKLAMWSIGKGPTSDKETTTLIEKINGWGKDTFDEILDNIIRVAHMNGNSYAEIITPPGEELKPDGSNLINLKPLNPGSIGHIINPQGILTGFKQKLSNGKEKHLRLNQVFYIGLNRTADEIHGTGDIESLITFLDKIKQVDEDMSVMFHRFVVPLVIWKLNTDDPVAMGKFKVQEKAAWNKGENLIIPDTAVDWSLLEAGKGVGSVVNPLDWRNKWTEEVIKGGGVPALIMAIESGTTEASSKMVFIAWQMTIDKEQRRIESQIKLQLGLKIKLPDPPKIDIQTVQDTTKKDGNSALKIKKSEATTTPGETK
ncbi:MAG TPA: hypothetical protein ENH23_07255 [candidate division Zixibacteria bacterium]|nr:hypothetical protein [candidate division Zixibacteria bacterium]